MAHTEAEVVRRVGASMVLGGVRKDVPALVIDDDEAFKAKLADRFKTLWSGVESTLSWDDVLRTVSASIPQMIEVIVEYDQGGFSGGAEWIRKNATPEEVYEGFKAVIAASFPFARDLVRYPTLLFQVLEQLTERSPSSPSPSGASTTDPD